MTGLLLLTTVISTFAAIVMSVVAWRVSRDERRRSDARISALAADIHAAPPDSVDLALRPEPAPLQSLPDPSTASTDLFATSRRGGGQSHWGFALIAGVLAMAAAAAVAVIFSGESRGAAVSAAGPVPRTAPSPGPTRGTPGVTVPLDLIALGQERDGDRLIVRGVVENPAGGQELDRLVAVVFGFGSDGEFRTSGRSALPSQALAPGAKSSFVVSLPDAADVVRYRVSFRTDDHVVPHADRRGKS